MRGANLVTPDRLSGARQINHPLTVHSGEVARDKAAGGGGVVLGTPAKAQRSDVRLKPDPCSDVREP